MTDFLLNPWPWYVAGPLISLIMFALIIGGKTFGVSSNLSTICSACGAGKVSSFFDFNWKAQSWNLVLIFGVLIGGYIASNFMTADHSITLASATVDKLNSIGISTENQGYVPREIFDLNNNAHLGVLIFLLAIGGFLVGFGARYAGGCTSGHAITGLSQLQVGSLIAVIGFFIGGLVVTHFIYPYIF
jgi:hypothetical protein